MFELRAWDRKRRFPSVLEQERANVPGCQDVSPDRNCNCKGGGGGWLLAGPLLSGVWGLEHFARDFPLYFLPVTEAKPPVGAGMEIPPPQQTPSMTSFPCDKAFAVPWLFPVLPRPSGSRDPHSNHRPEIPREAATSWAENGGEESTGCGRLCCLWWRGIKRGAFNLGRSQAMRFLG